MKMQKGTVLTMFRRTACLLLMGAVMSGMAWAHSLTVTASASCVSGVATISYTATSWCTTGAPLCNNPDIDILFNGATVDENGAFTPANGDVYSNHQPAPLASPTVTVEASADALWGDGFALGETDSVIVTVPTNCSLGTGRFTGGGKQVVVGQTTVVTVTKGFEVDCDLHTPSNNLEINWFDATGASHHFHMLTFDRAVCTLLGPPNPPKAPVNDIVASGTGRYDGTDGFTVNFELTDNGEPGTSDKAGFTVFETANPGNVVLNVPYATINTGNIQAHVDQK